jgi:Putative prokaryotic signal transducing protein
MRLVTVAIFNASFNAHLAQGRLQADGIECYIQDEHAIQLNPFYNAALGGIKLQVKDTDVEQAVFMLRQFGYPTVFDALPVVEKKQSHILIRFLKFLVATLIVLGLLYLREFGAKLPV